MNRLGYDVRDGPSNTLISDSTWKLLKEALQAPGLCILICVCSSPFIDDSPDDAAFKVAVDPASAVLRNKFPFNSEELGKLILLLLF